MAADLAAYFTGTITAHALFLSLGGLMAVNSIRSLAQIQQQGWEAYLDAKERNAKIIDVPGRNDRIERLKKLIRWFMIASLFIGFSGIMVGLAGTTPSSDISSVYFLFFASSTLLAVHVLVFISLVFNSLEPIGWWVAKAP